MNNTLIGVNIADIHMAAFNPKEQYEIMKKLDLPAAKIEHPDFDLS